MGRKLAGMVAALALLAVPAISLGDDDDATADLERRGLGAVVAKDVAKQHPAAAVARAELTEVGSKMSWRITTKPSGLPVDYAFIVRCEKASLFDYFPGPGDVTTRTRNAPFSGGYTVPLADPDFCDFQVFGSIPGESDKRGKVITKIYRK